MNKIIHSKNNYNEYINHHAKMKFERNESVEDFQILFVHTAVDISLSHTVETLPFLHRPSSLCCVAPSVRVVDCCDVILVHAIYWCVAACVPAVLPPVLQSSLGVAPHPSTWSVILSVILHTQIAHRQAPAVLTLATRHHCRATTTQAALRHVAPCVGFSVRIGQARRYWHCICRGSTLCYTTDYRLTRQVAPLLALS